MTDELEYEPIEPEIVRGFYPELTRCDHCGELDDKTERHTVNGEFFWLHEYCRELFVVPCMEPVYFNKRMVGFVVSSDGKQTWRAFKWIANRAIAVGEFQTATHAMHVVAFRQPLPPIPPGWFRSRGK